MLYATSILISIRMHKPNKGFSDMPKKNNDEKTKKNIKIIVAAHKKYQMPTDDVYLPLHVGAEGKKDDIGNSLDLGYTKDNSGDNISEKNASYCELTGLYWMWKNLDADYLGLVHYRRHFKEKGTGKNFRNVLTGKKLDEILDKHSLLLPKKRHYFIETNRSQYLHAHHKEGLEETENVIREFYPEYLKSFNTVMKRRSGHRFNMFIMSKSLLNDYCEWLFGILFRVEKRVDISSWNQSEQRVFGYLSERLLDVWIDKNNLSYKELTYMFMEKQSWIKKGFCFLKRKIAHGDWDKK